MNKVVSGDLSGSSIWTPPSHFSLFSSCAQTAGAACVRNQAADLPGATAESVARVFSRMT